MFKKHAVQMKIVKDSAANQNATPSPLTESADELIKKISKINVTKVVAGAVAIYAAVVAINTASEVVINYAPKK